MARRSHLALTALLAVIVFFSLSHLFFSPKVAVDTWPPSKPLPLKDPLGASQAQSEEGFKLDLSAIPEGILEGESIAPKLENATLKAELGRATWKFLHTMMARFPDTPTDEDRTALETFIHLFGRLYPCGECAGHFRKLMEEYPPQTSSRQAAAGWLCFAHNLVNERLEKPIFDCNTIGDFYDCGCAEDGKEKGEGAKDDEAKMSLELE